MRVFVLPSPLLDASWTERGVQFPGRDGLDLGLEEREGFGWMGI